MFIKSSWTVLWKNHISALNLFKAVFWMSFELPICTQEGCVGFKGKMYDTTESDHSDITEHMSNSLYFYSSNSILISVSSGLKERTQKKWSDEMPRYEIFNNHQHNGAIPGTLSNCFTVVEITLTIYRFTLLKVPCLITSKTIDSV